MTEKATIRAIVASAFGAAIFLTLVAHLPRPIMTAVVALIGVVVVIVGYLSCTGREHTGVVRRPWAPLALMAIGVLLTLVPEVVRRTSGTSNREWSPPVFGPGDTTRHEFDEDIRSVGGKWSGGGKAYFTVDGRDEPVRLRTASRKKDWGKRIRTRTWGAETPWVEVTIPDDETLAHTTGRIELDLNVRYPAGEEGGFVIEKRSFHFDDTVTLSAAGVADRYVWWWFAASLLGAAAVLGGLWWLEARPA